MDTEQRKAAIRRRLKLAQYPRRVNAVFNEANDHNPTVLEDCPHCYGTGQFCEHRTDDNVEVAVTDVCPCCSGSGITEELVPYFDNEAPAIPVQTDADGWLRCPHCGWRFSVKDLNVWSGYRHKRCGQRIKVV